MRRTHLAVTAALLSTCLTLTACGGSDSAPEAADASSLTELYEVAKKEGEILVYGPTEDLYAKVYEEFEAAYPGIKVKTTDIFGAELDSRLEGELVAGGFKADLLHIGVSDMERYATSDYLSPFRPVEADALEDDYRGKEDLWSVPSQHLYATVYNTKSLDEADVPDTWAELGDPGWKAKQGISDPSISGATPQVLSAALEAGVVDEKWLDDYAGKVKPKVFPSVATALQAVTTGETQASLVAGYGTYMRQKAAGAPLGYAVMKDGGYMSDVAYGTLDSSPHPNAARLLVSWMFSEEGQKSVAEHIYEFGTMPGAPEPEGAEELGKFEPITYPGAERYEKSLELLGEKF
ncbi:extracellular solute-binding protein [Streptomyces sp. NPDC050388]|uniref:ABC transporter substrate-binding protein n=1 Tax=Streptomyces sp. NPDC050388 TaxID=3155781 RepID=UPI0034180706